jgi:plastocyanin
MRAFILIAAAALLTQTYGIAQVVVPPGPAVRPGGGAVGAPAIDGPHIEQLRRNTNPNAWRMRRYNDEWWYYSPQSTWMYYRDNRWAPYQADAFTPLPPRYRTAYRGTYSSPAVRADRFAYGAAGAPTLSIAIRDNYFDPTTISIAPGTTVTWINNGTHEHTVTAVDGTWDSGPIAPDATYSARFKRPGVYSYVCDLHAEMKGTIQVGNVAQQQPPPAVQTVP